MSQTVPHAVFSSLSSRPQDFVEADHPWRPQGLRIGHHSRPGQGVVHRCSEEPSRAGQIDDQDSTPAGCGNGGMWGEGLVQGAEDVEERWSRHGPTLIATPCKEHLECSTGGLLACNNIVANFDDDLRAGSFSGDVSPSVHKCMAAQDPLLSEVERYLRRNCIHGHACKALTELHPSLQQQVMECNLVGYGDPSAVLLSRIDQVLMKRMPSEGHCGHNLHHAPVSVELGGTTADTGRTHSDDGMRVVEPSTQVLDCSAATQTTSMDPSNESSSHFDEVEQFLRHHNIDASACQALRKLQPELQRRVIGHDLKRIRNPSAYLLSIINKVRTTGNKLHTGKLMDRALFCSGQPVQSLGSAHACVADGPSTLASASLRNTRADDGVPFTGLGAVNRSVDLGCSGVPAGRSCEDEHAGGSSSTNSTLDVADECGSRVSAFGCKVDTYFKRHAIDLKARRAFWDLEPDVQRQVMEHDLGHSPKPTSYLLSLVSLARSGRLAKRARSDAPQGTETTGIEDHGFQMFEGCDSSDQSAVCASSGHCLELNEFIRKHDIDIKASEALRWLPPDLQQEVMQESSRAHCRNPSAVVWSCISSAHIRNQYRATRGGDTTTSELEPVAVHTQHDLHGVDASRASANTNKTDGALCKPENSVNGSFCGDNLHMAAADEERTESSLHYLIEDYLSRHGIDAEARNALLELPPSQQKEVIGSDIINCRNSSAVLLSRIRRVQKGMPACHMWGGNLASGPAEPRALQPAPHDQAFLEPGLPQPPDIPPPPHLIFGVCAPPPPVRPPPRQPESSEQVQEPTAKRARLDTQHVGVGVNDCFSDSARADAGPENTSMCGEDVLVRSDCVSALAVDTNVVSSSLDSEVEESLKRHCIDGKACHTLPECPAAIKKQVMQSDLVECPKTSELLWSHIRSSHSTNLAGHLDVAVTTTAVDLPLGCFAKADAEGVLGTSETSSLPPARHHDERGPEKADASVGTRPVKSAQHSVIGQSHSPSHLDLGVEGFLRFHGIDAKACHALRNLQPDLQRRVMELDPSNCRNPSAFLWTHIQKLCAPSTSEAHHVPRHHVSAEPGCTGKLRLSASLPPPPPPPPHRLLNQVKELEPTDERAAFDGSMRTRDEEVWQKSSRAWSRASPAPANSVWMGRFEMDHAVSGTSAEKSTVHKSTRFPSSSAQDHKPARVSLPRERIEVQGPVLFTLCRQGGAAELPAFVEITAGSPPLVVGRAASCDVVLRIQHVSKAHAQLHLQETVGGSWMLMLQDTSSNGTWLNGQKLNPRRFVQVRSGDRISFLPPTVCDSELEPPVYEVISGVLPSETSYEGPSPLLPECHRVADGRSMSIAVSPNMSNHRAVVGHSARHLGKDSRSVISCMPIQGGARLSTEIGHCSYGENEALPQEERMLQLGAQRQDNVLSVGCYRASNTHHLGASILTTAGTGPASAQHPLGERDINQWIQSLGAESLAQYHDLLLATYDDLKQIRDLYSEHIDDFFEDVGIESPEHREIFREALERLRCAI